MKIVDANQRIVHAQLASSGAAFGPLLFSTAGLAVILLAANSGGDGDAQQPLGLTAETQPTTESTVRPLVRVEQTSSGTPVQP
jgi:hypothetical protein